MDGERMGGAARQDYLAFLLRIWRESDRSSWRASLTSPHSGSQQGFNSLEELIGFLYRQLELPARAYPDRAGREGEEVGNATRLEPETARNIPVSEKPNRLKSERSSP